MTRSFSERPQNIDWRRINSVLFVRLRSIGDTVLMTPCLKAVKSWRPDIRITVVSEPLAAPLLDGHPLVDRLMVCGRSLGSRIALIRQVRLLDPGITFNLHGGSTATLITALSGAKITAGYAGYSLSWLETVKTPAPDVILGRAQLHSVEQQLALLHWCGVPFPKSVALQLAVCEKAAQSVTATLGNIDEYAVIAPAAALESKRWPASSFADVADYLYRNYKLPSVVIAGPGQEQVAEEVVRLAGPGPRALTGLSLKELAALLSRAAIFVGNDSGPMHVAAAFDRPIVAVFGPSNPAVWHPWTRATWSIPCSEELTDVDAPGGSKIKRATRLVGPASEGIDRIPGEVVIDSIKQVLQAAV